MKQEGRTRIIKLKSQISILNLWDRKEAVAMVQQQEEGGGGGGGGGGGEKPVLKAAKRSLQG